MPHTADVLNWLLFTQHRCYASPCKAEAVLLVCDALHCHLNLLASANLYITIEIIVVSYLFLGCIRYPSPRSVSEFVSYILVILKSTSLKVFRTVIHVKVLDLP